MKKDNKTSLVKGLRQGMNPLDYLARLEQRLPSTFQFLASVNYITLTRECNKLLKLMRVMINRNCDTTLPILPKLPTAYLYETVHPEMIMSALSEPLQVEKFEASLDSKLEVAREVLMKYLQRKQKKQKEEKTISANPFSLAGLEG